jgi:predicted translin family RNA/ssDNA-binding protein
MKNLSFLNQIKKRYAACSQARRRIFRASDDATAIAKRAIFALHRDDLVEGRRLLAEAGKLLKIAEAETRKHPELRGAGPFHAGLEEYTEALLFENYLLKGDWKNSEALKMDTDIYLGALSDATGELVRYAVRQATKGNIKAVKEAHAAVEATIGFLLEIDLTGDLRQKGDQAKRNLRTLEEMMYQVSLVRGGVKGIGDRG